MKEKLSEIFLISISIVMFFICAIIYNIGYFSILGDSMSYFFYIPANISDIIKTGLMMILPLMIFFLAFKSILIDPAFRHIFPGPKTLISISIAVMVSNLLYFSVFINSLNDSYALASEFSFYISALMCLIAIIYFLLSSASSKLLLSIFCISLIPVSFLIGSLDARIKVKSVNNYEAKSYIITQEMVIEGNIIRSLDKGLLYTANKAKTIDFITWDKIKEIRFRKVSGF